jgi:peptidoglycan/xylan/chitin deacetylase (PgdA/CDA1 family)
MRWFSSKEIILLYHRVACVSTDPWGLCVTPAHFSQHLEVLRKYRRIRLNQVQATGLRIGRGSHRVAITFDDGYADNLHEAARLLEKYDTPATFFVATGYIGGVLEFWWDELERLVFQSADSARYYKLYDELQPLPHRARREVLDQMLASCGQNAAGRLTHRALTPEETAELGGNELFEVGAHTVTHPVLAAQVLRDQYIELQESKTWLETLLGRPIVSFSYPYGGSHHYTADTVHAVRALGFSRACSVTGHAVAGKENVFELPRINVTDMDGEAFEKMLFS